ncbi:MAG: efflux transporter outer membrane subunit [Thermodesulforhabdaceae bacterium]
MDGKFARFAIVSLTTVIIVGCVSVGPDYIKPEVPLPEKWRNLTSTRVEETTYQSTFSQEQEKDLARWWQVLGDPELTRLVERSIKNNMDIAKAQAKVREARARRAIAAAPLFPTLGTSFSASGKHQDLDKGSTTTQDFYTAEFDSSWEIDIFGGTRRAIEASQRTLEATEEALRDVLVSVVAEVALNYLELRTYQARLAVAKENLLVQEESLQLASWRYQAGLTSELDVHQARYNLESTRAQIPILKTAVDEAMNRLAVLLGESPGKLHEELNDFAPVPLPPDRIAVGIPADILRRRPDIRKAERELAAQTARIGVAMAELYPKFSLTGSIGIEALSPGGLVSSATKTLMGQGIISLPIFKGGALKQAVEAEKALAEQALVTYKATILNALEEVENTLMAYSEELRRQESLAKAEEAARQAAELAKQRYASGLIDFGAVLEAERSHLAFQDQLIQSRGAVTSNIIRLYKALGGGWDSYE